MTILIDTRTGPIVQGDGAGDQPLRQGRMGSLVTAPGHGRYYEQSSRRNMFMAQANMPAAGMIAYTATAAQGGPLLWNGNANINACIVAVGWAITTAATTTNLILGLTGQVGQFNAPTSTTAADGRTNLYLGGPASQATPYRLGTVSVAATSFLPIGSIHLGAITVDTVTMNWVELASAFVVPPYCWASPAASATSTAVVMTLAMIWEEVPIGT